MIYHDIVFLALWTFAPKKVGHPDTFQIEWPWMAPRSNDLTICVLWVLLGTGDIPLTAVGCKLGAINFFCL